MQAQADAPIRRPPVVLITERALALKALTESADVDGARATLRRYLKDGQITPTPEPFRDAQAYTARFASVAQTSVAQCWWGLSSFVG
jgi:hypothetical protein